MHAQSECNFSFLSKLTPDFENVWFFLFPEESDQTVDEINHIAEG